jgi:hypothetical protein
MEPMKTEEILKLWEEDAQINQLKLTEELVKIPKLHHKYFSILLGEKQRLRALEISYAEVYKERFEHYTQGPAKEDKPAKWTGLPAKGLSSKKSEIEMYISADENIIKVNIKIGDQKEKIELLESIINLINNRSYHIRNIIDWTKFQAGS